MTCGPHLEPSSSPVSQTPPQLCPAPLSVPPCALCFYTSSSALIVPSWSLLWVLWVLGRGHNCLVLVSSGQHLRGWPSDCPSPPQPAPRRWACRRAPLPTPRSLPRPCTWASWVCSAGPRSWPACTRRASSTRGHPATMTKTPGSRYGRGDLGVGDVMGECGCLCWGGRHGRV